MPRRTGNKFCNKFGFEWNVGHGTFVINFHATLILLNLEDNHLPDDRAGSMFLTSTRWDVFFKISVEGVPDD